MYDKSSLILALTMIIILNSPSLGKRNNKNKRQASLIPPLVYPFGGTLKLLFGYSMPINIPGRILVYGQNFQFQFPLPLNATFFADYFNITRPLVPRRRKRNSNDYGESNERRTFYKAIEEEVGRRGGPGNDCLKRSICEYAESPLLNDGLVGEILHVMLTPDYGDGSLSSFIIDEEYTEAAKIGRSGGDCATVYSDCPAGFGLLDHVTTSFI